MNAIDNIRRDLREHAYLEHSIIPFAGMVHDFKKPLRERLEQRKHTSPYYWSPATPGGERGFYQASRYLGMDRAGSTFELRLEDANEHLGHSRLAQITGYYTDDDCNETLKPIVARLPHSRGFLAGWTMGAGMCASLELDVYETIEDAARVAHSVAEYAAERERDYQEKERARLEEEERIEAQANEMEEERPDMYAQ